MSVHELFRLLVGEIGISRHEFWYELTWSEVRAIIDGYNRRRRDGWEQARLVAYHVAYCMGVPQGKTVPLITDWLPFQWERQSTSANDGDDGNAVVTPDTTKRLREIMMEENARAEAKAKAEAEIRNTNTNEAATD